MSQKSKLAALGLAGVVFGCKTSGDLASGRDTKYVDPTQVKTISAPSAPDIANENLQQELAIARGNYEDLKAQSTGEQQRLQKRIAELEEQNKKLTEQLTRAGETKTVVVDGALPSGKTGAPLLWELGTNDLKAGKFQQALSPFNEIVQTYPKDTLAYGALLNVGLIQYRLQKYAEAAVTFNQVIDKYGSRKETVVAWFGQAAAFAQMNQLDDAKLFFEEVTKRYPKSDEAKVARKIMDKKEKVPADLFSLARNYKQVRAF